jgi:hypothetical protein
VDHGGGTVKALIGTAAVLLATHLTACGNAEGLATSRGDKPLLPVLVTPWGLYVEQQAEPITPAKLETMLAAVDDQPGVVRLDSAVTLSGYKVTGRERSKVDRLSRTVAALVRRHGLPIVTEAGRMPVRGWASPSGNVDP